MLLYTRCYIEADMLLGTRCNIQAAMLLYTRCYILGMVPETSSLYITPPVYNNIARLPYSPGALPRLQICRRIPVGVINDNAIGACEVRPQAPHLGRQEKAEYFGIAVELIDFGHARFDV